MGYEPRVILAGRAVNDGMGAHVAQRVIRFLGKAGLAAAQARVGVLGLTFKENVRDLRNSRVPDILAELRAYGVEPLVADPMADAALGERMAGTPLTPVHLDGADENINYIEKLRPRHFADVKGCCATRKCPLRSTTRPSSSCASPPH